MIFELRRHIAVKLCHVIGSMFGFIINVPKFGGRPKEKNWGPKRANFGTISPSFRTLQTWTANICETDGDIENGKDTWSTTISPAFGEKVGEFWSSDKKVGHIWVRLDPNRLSKYRISAFRGTVRSRLLWCCFEYFALSIRCGQCTGWPKNWHHWSVTSPAWVRRPTARRTRWTFDAKTAGCDSYFRQ